MFSFANKAGSSILPKRVKALSRWIAHPFLSDRKGVTAIEFAIALPLFLLVVFGTLEFGRALKARNEMSYALSRAVRVLNLDPTQNTDDIAAFIKTYLAGYASDGSDDSDDSGSANGIVVSVISTTIEGTDYMKILVSFPFDTIIPYSSTSLLDLRVETIAPVVSATK